MVSPGAYDWSAFIVRETGEFAHLHPHTTEVCI